LVALYAVEVESVEQVALSRRDVCHEILVEVVALDRERVPGQTGRGVRAMEDGASTSHE
jgi:hypothetical protein